MLEAQEASLVVEIEHDISWNTQRNHSEFTAYWVKVLGRDRCEGVLLKQVKALTFCPSQVCTDLWLNTPLRHRVRIDRMKFHLSSRKKLRNKKAIFRSGQVFSQHPFN